MIASWAPVSRLAGFVSGHNWLLAAVSAVCLLLEAWIVVEAAVVFFSPKADPA